MRRHTVKNTAAAALGTGTAGRAGKTDSFSKPIEEPDSTGLDVAFALSYSEAANFISKEYAWGGGATEPSGTIASENFAKMQIPGDDYKYDKLWLRSPGTDSAMASTLGSKGRVFQAGIDGTIGGNGLIYPALWVDMAIFE